MSGLEIRMGVIVKQDYPFTIQVVDKLMDRFDDMWSLYGEDMPLWEISAAVFVLGTFLGGIRGYEVVWADLGAWREELAEMDRADEFDSVPFPLVGRFKGEGGASGNHVIPLASITESGFTPLIWIQRLVDKLNRRGVARGWAFIREDDGSRADAAYYQDAVFGKLLDIQSEPSSPIPDSVNVYEDYGMQRSGRRGFTTHAKNLGFLDDDISLICRWQTDKNRGGRAKHSSMVSAYTEYRQAKQARTKISRKF